MVLHSIIRSRYLFLHQGFFCQAFLQSNLASKRHKNEIKVEANLLQSNFLTQPSLPLQSKCIQRLKAKNWPNVPSFHFEMTSNVMRNNLSIVPRDLNSRHLLSNSTIQGQSMSSAYWLPINVSTKFLRGLDTSAYISSLFKSFLLDVLSFYKPCTPIQTKYTEHIRLNYYKIYQLEYKIMNGFSPTKCSKN